MYWKRVALVLLLALGAKKSKGGFFGGTVSHSAHGVN